MTRWLFTPEGSAAFFTTENQNCFTIPGEWWAFRSGDWLFTPSGSPIGWLQGGWVYSAAGKPIYF